MGEKSNPESWNHRDLYQQNSQNLFSYFTSLRISMDWINQSTSPNLRSRVSKCSQISKEVLPFATKVVKYIRDLQYLISANTLTLKAKWHENDFGIFIKGVNAINNNSSIHASCTTPKEHFGLTIFNFETKNIGDRGFDLWVFLDQNNKIYIQVYKHSNFSGKE